MRHTIELKEQPPENCDTDLFDASGVGWFYEGLDSDGDCDSCWPMDEFGLRCPIKPGDDYEGGKVIAVAMFYSDVNERWQWEIETDVEPISRVSIHTKQFVSRYLAHSGYLYTVGQLMEALSDYPPELKLNRAVELVWFNIGSEEPCRHESLGLEGE